jgi:putative FmdB family regulatory protein
MVRSTMSSGTYTAWVMPTYEYACKQCGHRVEVVQPMSDEPLKTCGVCGGELRKVFHPAGLLFKGSGFYATDNRAKDTGDEPEKPEKKAEKADGKKADAPSSSPSPSKKDDGSTPSSSSAKGSGGEGGSSGGSSPTAKEESA